MRAVLNCAPILCPVRSRAYTQQLTPMVSCLHLFLFLLSAQYSTADVTEYGCKPRNRDLHPKARLNLGILHRPSKCEKKTQTGDKMKVHYEARLFRDCHKFDSSRDRGEPHEFELGDGTTIKGWEQGLVGMCVGERRKLLVPSGLAYGAAGADEIPPNATIIYDIELL